MSRSILIMAGGTGGHIFGYAITRAARALVCAENVAEIEVLHV
jgi:UDP-N-acetylglucosamine:LPS N-acetylglucosamine transferase